MSAELSRRPVSLGACMGGFCDMRSNCARYLAANRAYPSERLCSPGRSEAFLPVVAVSTKPHFEEFPR